MTVVWPYGNRAGGEDQYFTSAWLLSDESCLSERALAADVRKGNEGISWKLFQICLTLRKEVADAANYRAQGWEYGLHGGLFQYQPEPSGLALTDSRSQELCK